MFLKKIDSFHIREIFSITLILVSILASLIFMLMLPGKSSFLFESENMFLSFSILLACLFPSLCKLTIPIALLLATTFVTVKNSLDGELQGWCASGVSPLRLAWGGVFLGAIFSVIVTLSFLFFEPYANKQFRQFKLVQTTQIIDAALSSNLKEGMFIDNLIKIDNQEMFFYFEKVNSSKRSFDDVFISTKSKNKKDSFFIFSQKGKIEKTFGENYPDYKLVLNNGTLYSFDTKSSGWTILSFDKMDLSLIDFFQGQFRFEEKSSNSVKHLYPSDVYSYFKEQLSNPEWKKDGILVRGLCSFLGQFSFALACLLFPLIGASFGIRDARHHKAFAFLGVVIILGIFYASLVASTSLAVNQKINPFLAIFIAPLFLIIVAALCLDWRSNYTLSTTFLEYIFEKTKRSRHYLKNRVKK